MLGKDTPFRINYGVASATSGGIVTTGAQTFAGDKTFSRILFTPGTDPSTSGSTPAFTTRGVGAKIVLCNSISGSAVDWALGMDTSGSYVSMASTFASNTWKIYAGTTVIQTTYATGLLDNTGTVRATGNTNPAAGTGAEMQFVAGGALFAGVNRTGGVYVPSTVAGSTVTIATGTGAATNSLVCSPTVNTSSAPLAVGASGTAITQVKVYSQTITPASVGGLGATGSVQTFTVTGLATTDKVTLNTGAAATTGTGIGGVRCSATDTLEITYYNSTVGALTPVSSTCQILATRS